jgi:hypothetical protein
MNFQIVLFSTALAVGASLAAGGAMAGSCPGGPAPIGAVVHGPVLEIPDASSLCIAKAQSPSTWVRVRLARASNTYPLLMAAAFGKNAVCTIRHNGWGVCDIEGQPLDVELKRPQTIEASISWR